MNPDIVSRACLYCPEELRFDPWMGQWVDRHHATRVGPMRISAKKANVAPHAHRATGPWLTSPTESPIDLESL